MNARRIGIVGLLGLAAIGLLTSGPARYQCGRCADQRTTVDLFGLPIVEIEPHYDEYGVVRVWEQAHGVICRNLWRRGPFDSTRTDNPFFPPLQFKAATVRSRAKAEAMMLQEPAADLNKQDALGRTPMHWLAAASGIGALESQLRQRGVRLDIKDEDGLTPLDWDWRARPPSESVH